MLTRCFIRKTLVIISIALLFLFTGTESLTFFSTSIFVGTAEAKKSDKDKDKDKNKDKDKDKDKDSDGECDLGENGFCYKKDKFEVTADCKDVKVLKVDYHKDFVSTEDATGPNVLVVGVGGKKCSIVIEKIPPGNNKCGFRVFIENDRHYGKTLRVLTNPKDKAKNCEMCIKLEVPRKIHIGPPPSGVF